MKKLVLALLLCASTAHAGQICFDIPDDQLADLQDKLAAAGKYEEVVQNLTPLPNPVKKPDFVSAMVRGLVLDFYARLVVQQQANDLDQAVRATIATKFLPTPTPGEIKADVAPASSVKVR